MKAPLFEYPSYQYQIKDWEFKKKGLLKRLKGENFIIIKSSSIMFCRMDKEHTVHGIEHDEGTTF